MSSTSLRFPYSVSVKNEGALRVTIYNPKIDETLYAGGGEMATIHMYQDDKGYDLQFTITDVDGDAFNLTGGDVYFRMAKAGDTSLTINGSCTLDADPTTGRCNYTVQDGDLTTAGKYEAELYISVASKEIRIQDMDVLVRERLPTS